MATEELITDKDIEDIGAAIQLAPHANQTQFTLTSVNSEGDPLVSLDELYEKTGQETINIIVAGIRRLKDDEKFSAKEAKAFKISGTESYSPGYSKLNAIKGGENFFTKIKDTLVSVVKAIIAFIKGVCNWIVDKFKVLFGFSKTAKQVKFLEENSKEINHRVSRLLTKTSSNIDMDVDKLLNSLPSGYTDKEVLSLYKSRYDSNAEAIKKLNSLESEFTETMKFLDKLSGNALSARNKYIRAMDDLRKKFRPKDPDVRESDIASFINVITVELFVTLDYTELYQKVSELANKVYGVEIKDIGLEKPLGDINKLLKDTLERIKTKVDPATASVIKENQKVLAKTLMEYDKYKMPDAYAKVMNMFIKAEDSEFIQLLANSNLPIGGLKDLPALYLEFSNKVKEFNNTVYALTNILTDISASYTNMITWYYRTEALINAYLIRDVEKILEAHQKYLTEEERKQLENSDGSPSSLLDLEKGFMERYPGFNLQEAIAEANSILLETPKIKTALKNSMKSLNISVRGI